MNYNQFVTEWKDAMVYQPDWFDFEEVKPTEQGHYLVKCKTSYPKNCDVVVAEFYEDNKTFYSESSDCPLHDVTHWRHIERS